MSSSSSRLEIENIRIGSFNVRGITSTNRRNQLDEDLDRYKLGIICLQETKTAQQSDETLKHSRLILLKPDCRHYGLGFMIRKDLEPNIIHIKSINDRVAYIQIKLEDNRSLIIINVYAPHSQLTEKDPNLLKQLYSTLDNLITEKERENHGKNIVLLAGDFNSKIGRNVDNVDECLGQYSRGVRNQNGQALVDFCNRHRLFITNSAFKHPARHQTTWSQTRTKNNETITIYNMIDFIICPQRFKSLFTDSRSYSGTLLTSDHRVVIGKLDIKLYKIKRCNKQTIPDKFNINMLKKINKFNKKKSNQYKKTLDTKLGPLLEDTDMNAKDKWRKTREVILETADKVIGKFSAKYKTNTENSIIKDLSKKQKEIRLKIQDKKHSNKVQELRRERNATLNELRQEIMKENENTLNTKLEELKNSSESTKMFKAVKNITNKKQQNKKVLDKDNNLITDPNRILQITTEFFENKFHDDNVETILPFEGPLRNLNTPITLQEVGDAISKLNNNRAPGEDNVTSELLKYGQGNLTGIITGCLNECLENHIDLEINNGILLSLQKPGKEVGPLKNLRPITLLNTIRKVLSIVTLNRIREKSEEYISPNQSGFRPNRSTADVAWTHKWLAAKVQKENIEIFITGIDFSSAFDTIRRSELLKIAEEFLEEDEIRMIRYLLSNTNIKPKINSADIETKFEANIGTPQGDSISPVLFNIYLEKTLKEIRPELDQTIKPNEIEYADDVDFVSTRNYLDIDKITPKMKKYNLIINKDKTEYVKLKRDTDRKKESWRE